MRTEQEIEQDVIETIRRRLRRNHCRIGADTRFREDLGADSLDLIEVAFELEQRLNVPIPDERFVEIRTVGDVVKYVQQEARK